MFEVALCFVGLNVGFVLGAWFQSRIAHTQALKMVLDSFRRLLESAPDDAARLRIVRRVVASEPEDLSGWVEPFAGAASDSKAN